jgi:hypothetical protein
MKPGDEALTIFLSGEPIPEKLFEEVSVLVQGEEIS